MKQISVAEDYTKFPGGRYKKNGPGSGEEFREKFLLGSLRSDEKVVVDLDGTSGYPSSFLEEAFGGLVREGFEAGKIKSMLEIRASDEFRAYKALIYKYIGDAEEARKRLN